MRRRRVHTSAGNAPAGRVGSTATSRRCRVHVRPAERSALDRRDHLQPADQPGRLVEGATVERTARFLGRRFDYGYVVTRHEPDRLVELKVDRPFPMLVRYELDDAADGTLVAIRANGKPGPLLWVATPLMERQVRKSITVDLQRLRTCLEA